MRPPVISLTALALLSSVSSQDFNPQPQLGEYPPLGGDYAPGLSVSRSDYDYVGEDPSYYVPPYSPGSGIDSLETFPNPPQRDGYVPLNDESVPPINIPNIPDISPNYGAQSNQYNPGSISRQPVFPVNPLPYPYSSSDYENYASTFNSPPLQGSYSPLPPVNLPASSSPNIIREDEDGKHLSEAKTSSTNQTFPSVIPQRIDPNLELGYGQDAVPTTTYDGRGYPAGMPQYYPETNFPEQSYNPNFRQFVNPFPFENIQPSVNLSSKFPIDPNQSLGNTTVPKLTGTISPDNYPTQYPDDTRKLFGDNPPIYPSAPSADVPDISLSGSPRNPSGYDGFTPSGRQLPGDDLPYLPNLSYEAPGHEVLA